MKAVCYKRPGKVACEEVERLSCRETGIIVRVAACGICGSDLHLYRHGLLTEMITRSSEQGPIPGHEFSGEVVEVGGKVNDIRVGDRVAALGQGAMAQYVSISRASIGTSVFKLPKDLSYEEAATIEPLATSFHACSLAGAVQEEHVVVFGAGIIGLGIVQCLVAQSKRPSIPRPGPTRP